MKRHEPAVDIQLKVVVGSNIKDCPLKVFKRDPFAKKNVSVRARIVIGRPILKLTVKNIPWRKLRKLSARDPFSFESMHGVSC